MTASAANPERVAGKPPGVGHSTGLSAPASAFHAAVRNFQHSVSGSDTRYHAHVTDDAAVEGLQGGLVGVAVVSGDGLLDRVEFDDHRAFELAAFVCLHGRRPCQYAATPGLDRRTGELGVRGQFGGVLDLA